MPIMPDATAEVQHGPTVEWPIVHRSLHDADPRFLDRAGLVRMALDRWFFLNPTDRRPTVDQLVSVGHNLHRRTVQRGLKDLAEMGEVWHVADPGSRVGRQTFVRSPLAHSEASAAPSAADVSPPPGPVTDVSPADTLVALADTLVAPADNPGAPNLSHLRSSNEVIPKDVERWSDRSVMNPEEEVSRSPSPPPSLPIRPPTRDSRRSGDAQPKPMGDVLAKLKRLEDRRMGEAIAAALDEPKLADCGRLERQERLPIAVPTRPDPPLKVSHPRPACDDRLMAVVGRLETGDQGAIEPAVRKMVEVLQAGGFERLFRKVAYAVHRKTLAMSILVDCLEDACKGHVIDRGMYFVAMLKLRRPGFCNPPASAESQRPAVHEPIPVAGVVRA